MAEIAPRLERDGHGIRRGRPPAVAGDVASIGFRTEVMGLQLSVAAQEGDEFDRAGALRQSPSVLVDDEDAGEFVFGEDVFGAGREVGQDFGLCDEEAVGSWHGWLGSPWRYIYLH